MIIMYVIMHITRKLGYKIMYSVSCMNKILWGLAQVNQNFNTYSMYTWKLYMYHIQNFVICI